MSHPQCIRCLFEALRLPVLQIPRQRHCRVWLVMAASLSMAGCGQLSSLLHSDMQPAPVETVAPATTNPKPQEAVQPAAAPAPSMATPAEPAAGAAPASSVAATALPPAAPSPVATASAVAVAANDGAKPYYVHIGAFGVPANASNAYQKVQATGIMVTTQEIDTPKGRLTRVRAGPFLSRADAEVAAKRIHELELDAVILRDTSTH